MSKNSVNKSLVIVTSTYIYIYTVSDVLRLNCVLLSQVLPFSTPSSGHIFLDVGRIMKHTLLLSVKSLVHFFKVQISVFPAMQNKPYWSQSTTTRILKI